MLAQRLIGLAALASATAHAWVAHADGPRPLQVAAPAPPPRALQIATEPRPEPSEAAVFNFEAGTAVIPSRTPGAYGRGWIEYLRVSDRRRPSFAWGFWGGWEGFRAGGVWGLAFPLMGVVGVKTPRMRLSVAGGANLFGIGAVDETFGGGLIQPRAHARLGFRVGKTFVSTTGDVQYGWGWGHPAQVVLMTGISVGIVMDEKKPRK